MKAQRIEGTSNPPTTNRRVNLIQLQDQARNAEKITGLDWLEVHMQFSSTLSNLVDSVSNAGLQFGATVKNVCINNFRFVLLYVPSRLCMFRFEIWQGQDLIGGGTCGYRGGVNGFTDNSAVFKFNNKVLYNTELQQLMKFLNNSLLFKAFVKFVRVDTFTDVNTNLIYPLFRVLSEINENSEIQLKQNQKFQVWGWDTRTGLPDTVTIGSMASDTQVTVYNKTKELEVSGKAYISQLHTDNFTNITQFVTRVETRIKGDYIHRYFTELSDIEQLENILTCAHVDAVNQRLTFLIKRDNVNRRYWEQFGLDLITNMVKIQKERIKKGESSGTRFYKIMANRMILLLLSDKMSKAEFLYMVSEFSDMYSYSLFDSWIVKKLTELKKKGIYPIERIEALQRVFYYLNTAAEEDNTQTALAYLRRGKTMLDIYTDQELPTSIERETAQWFCKVLDYCPF